MPHFSRRAVRREAIGTSGLAGAPSPGRTKIVVPLGVILVVLVASLLAPAHVPAQAAFPKIRFFVSQPSFEPGQTMKLKLKEGVKRQLRVRVTDSTGTVWQKVRKTGRKQVWTATADQPGTGAVSIRMKRSDGRVFRRAVAYTVTATPTATPTPTPTVPPPSTMPAPLMGVSAMSNGTGGTMDWDSFRVYNPTGLGQIANRTGVNRPVAILYSKQADPLGGTNPSYTSVYNEVLADLNAFYYTSGTGQTHSTRWGIELYWSNGNEMGNLGSLFLATNAQPGGHTPAQVAAFTNSQRALYDAIHYVDPATGQRRFPDAHAGSDPTTEQERSNWVAEWLHPTIQYHDFVAWSMYPPGRKDTTADPTFNWASTNPTDSMTFPHGYVVRCMERVRQALDAAGLPRDAVTVHVGEVGIGDDPDDSTTRPYWAVHGFMHPLVTISEAMGIPLGTVNWWDGQLDASSPQNILNDEPTTTNPSTRVAFQNWATYDHLRGGTHPSTWAANPNAGWKTTGRLVY